MFPSVTMRKNSTVDWLTCLSATSWYLKMTRLLSNFQESSVFKNHINSFGVTYKDRGQERFKINEWTVMKTEPSVTMEGYIRETCFANTCLLRTQRSQEVQCMFCLTATHQNQIHRTSPDQSFLVYQKEWNIYKTTVSHSHMPGMCAHAQVPTSPTFGCKSRCSQACIKLSTIPSPNKPASTVSVTTKETLDKKKNTMK